MKKTLLITSMIMGGVFGAAAANAASNVTLYGVIEEGVLVGKAHKGDTTVQLKSGFDQGSRWGIKGTEDLGNGYSVGFILEQGFDADSGSEATAGKQWHRESVINVKGGFGALTFGRTGALSSGAQSQTILTGWALGTGYGNSAWTSIGKNFSRMDNVVSYVSPEFSGFTIHAMYSNGQNADEAKWSGNNHYYGLGVKYKQGAILSSLIFEVGDGKALKDKAEPVYAINYGLEYNLGSWTPMFAYQYNWQDGGNKNHIIGLSASSKVAGGTVKVGARYLFGKTDNKDLQALNGGEDKQRVWTVGAAYDYPLSKRTAVKFYAGYAGGDKNYDSDGKYTAKDADGVKQTYLYGSNLNYNGWQAYVGMRHSF